MLQERVEIPLELIIRTNSHSLIHQIEAGHVLVAVGVFTPAVKHRIQTTAIADRRSGVSKDSRDAGSIALCRAGNPRAGCNLRSVSCDRCRSISPVIRDEPIGTGSVQRTIRIAFINGCDAVIGRYAP